MSSSTFGHYLNKEAVRQLTMSWYKRGTIGRGFAGQVGTVSNVHNAMSQLFFNDWALFFNHQNFVIMAGKIDKCRLVHRPWHRQ